MERDSHGNFPFSQVETEKVLMGLVQDYLNILKEQGRYRLGIHKSYYRKTLKRAGLDADAYGPLLFEEYEQAEILLRRSEKKTFFLLWKRPSKKYTIVLINRAKKLSAH